MPRTIYSHLLYYILFKPARVCVLRFLSSIFSTKQRIVRAYAAIKHGEVRTMRDLLEQDPSLISAEFANNNTLLHEAVWLNQPQIVQVLLKAGADPNARNNCGLTPLHFTAIKNNQKLAKYLIRLGANVHLKDSFDNTALHYAANPDHELFDNIYKFCKIQQTFEDKIFAIGYYPYPHIIETFLKAGADPNSKNTYSYTPLHLAASNSHVDITKVLLQSDCYVNIRNDHGETPLMLATERGNHHVVVLLLNMGADINITHNKSLTALDYAISWRHSAEIKFLLLYPGDDVVKIIQRYISMIRLANMYLTDDFEKYRTMMLEMPYQEDILLSDIVGPEFMELCEEELIRLKTTKIGNTLFTYYDFLKKRGQALVNAIKNEDITAILSSEGYKREFVFFSRLISNQFHLGLYRAKLNKKIISQGPEIFKTLPVECVETLLSYLPMEDLFKFAEGFN